MKQVNINFQGREENGNYNMLNVTRTAPNKALGTASVFAGNLKISGNETALIKQSANRKAMRKILDQFGNEKNIDKTIEDKKKNQQKLNEVMDQAANEVHKLRQRRQELMDSYGIAEDSEEETNLELLEKSLFGSQELTSKEVEQLKKIGPLTQYQKNALQNSAMEQVWMKRIEGAKNGIFNDAKTIIAIQLERLKTHPMVDAQKEAAKIIEEAVKQVVSMVVEDTKEQFDEQQQEKLEEAKRQQEENSEKQEKIEKARLEREIKESKDKEGEGTSVSSAIEYSVIHSNNSISLNNTDLLQQELQASLKNITQRKNLLQEDIKGLVIDELF